MTRLYIEKIVINAMTPSRATEFSAGYDIHANLLARDVKFFRNSNMNRPTVEPVDDKTIVLFPSERAMIPTGWRMCCDPGWKIEIAPRSGLAIKEGISLINCIGILDADYRHEAMVLAINHSDEPVEIRHEERICQLSLEPVYHIDIVKGKLPHIESSRNGGMGSTGK